MVRRPNGWRLFGLFAEEAAASRPAIPGHDLPEARRLALAQVLDALPAPTILVDARGVVVHANQVAREAFPGFRHDAPFSAAIRAPEVLEALDQVLAGKEVASALLVEHVPVERSFGLSMRRIAGVSEPGEALAAIHMSETTQARQAEAMRVDFVANASHELRTPLASILGFVETLQGPARADAKAQAHFLDIMATQARRMSRLIDDLLSLSRIEMNAHLRPAGRTDLRLLLPQLVDALSGLAQDRGVSLALDMMPDIAGDIPGDRDELMRAFENLIENAIKYGRSGGRIDIRLGAGEAKDELAVSVRDYGPGIAAEHLPRLTERFYRADVQESRIQGGTGLGLAIVKHIVMRHRGRLAITSEPGAGATFAVMLPSG